MNGGVYLQTNDAERNEVVAFARRTDGRLEPRGRFATGGRGSGSPHLTSQGSVVLTEDGGHLLVTNAGSGDVSLLAFGDGGLELVDLKPSGGRAPQSVAERDGLVYVLNTAAPASVAAFRLERDRLAAVGELRELSAPAADPAQVGFSPDSSTLVVTERGTDSIVTFAVEPDGRLGETRVHPSSGPTPYGFAFAGTDTLVVTEAFGAERGKAAASSYRLAGGELIPITRSLGNGRSEICWAVPSPDGRFVFTTNFADGAVSRYAVGAEGEIELDAAAAATAFDGQTGLRDEDVSVDGRFLYAIDADSRQVFGWEVEDGGGLRPIGSWDGLPSTIAGLAAS